MYKKIKTNLEIDLLVSMAKEIWTQHFTPLLGEKNVKKIIQIAQSKDVIVEQLAASYKYYFILEEGKEIGYFAYTIDDKKKELFLSKIYVYASQRGKGIARKVINYLIKICTQKGLTKIGLVVLCTNSSSVAAYEKMGFVKEGEKENVFDDELTCIDFKMSLHIL